MKIRVHIEYIGGNKVRITKFSGQKTIELKDLVDKYFDFGTFKFVDDADNTDFCISIWDGDGTISYPYELAVHIRNHDIGRLEFVDEMHPTQKRELTIEGRV